MQINKQKYHHAIYSQTVIDKAVATLDELTLEILAGDNELRAELDGFSAGLEVARQNHQKLIDAGKAAEKNVDPRLVSECLGRLGKLEHLIPKKDTEIREMSLRYDERCRLAIQLRTPVESFRPLDVPPKAEDEVRVAREKALLELEQRNINEFLKSIPFCDFSLLAGTAVEKFLPKEAAAA